MRFLFEQKLSTTRQKFMANKKATTVGTQFKVRIYFGVFSSKEDFLALILPEIFELLYVVVF